MPLALFVPPQIRDHPLPLEIIHGYLIILSLSFSLSLSHSLSLSLSLGVDFWENLSIRSESSSFVGGTKDHCNTAGCCAGTHSQPIRTNDFISAKRIDIFFCNIYIAISFLGHLFIIYSDGASSATGQRSTFTVSNCKFFSPPEIEISRGEQDFFIFTV